MFYGVELDTAAAMGAVVDACISLRLRSLKMFTCRVAPATLPELTRLIDAGVLRELTLNVYDSFDEAESTRLFVAAVRASAMTKLEILEYVSPKIVVDAAAFINARQH